MKRFHRRSLRLKNYDYAQSGVYFVTTCTYHRQCLFGNIVNGIMHLNECGVIVRDEWLRSAKIRNEIVLDEFIVMPNHFHGIVIIEKCDVNCAVGAHGRAPLHRSPRSVGSFLAGFKSIVTKRINELRQAPGQPVWQRNYHDRVIRNECELNHIRNYIINNPMLNNGWDV